VFVRIAVYIIYGLFATIIPKIIPCIETAFPGNDSHWMKLSSVSKRASGSTNLEKFLDLFTGGGIIHGDIVLADDSVHGRADFVAHMVK